MQKPFYGQLHPMRAPATTLTEDEVLPGPTAMQKRDRLTDTKLYQRVESVLRETILGGRLPEGVVLLEKPIAGILQTSRAPVQRALRMLETAGLIHRFDGRGYLVGPAAGGSKPLRRDLRAFDLILPDT